MNLYDWAKNEIKIACKNRSDCNESDEYYKACCESALRAYDCLLDDGHSGMSWNITKNILRDLCFSVLALFSQIAYIVYL